MIDASDDELIALVIANRDTAAFGELVRRHQPVVCSMLTRMTGARDVAEDIAQEAFVRAFKKIDSYEGRGAFRGWLCRIATTEFLMAKRKQKAGERAIDRMAASDPDFGREGAPDPDRGDTMDLDRALAQLSEPERICVVLCYATGMSHGEASEATGMPLGTVKSHVNRGRAKLRELLAAHQEAS